MAGTLTISTLSDGTNSTSSTNCIQGSAKAWVNFNGTTAPPTIRAQYNVSSVTKNASGDYTVNFTNAMSDANYSVNGVVQSIPAVSAMFFTINNTTTPLTTSSVRVDARGTDQTQRDVTYACVGIFR